MERIVNAVLAAVDGTPAARCVLATASAVSQVLHLDARAVYVGDSPELVAGDAQELGLPLTVMHGPPHLRIIEAGEGPDVDLVVLALHGLPKHSEPGHTARAVATHLSKPVLVVPPEEPIRPVPRKVLFPLDGTRGVSAAVRPLIATYVAAGAEVIAVHVFEPNTVPRFLDGVPDEIVWRDEFLAQHCADLGIRLETRPGPTVLALLDVATREDVDVIALGWRQNLAPAHAQIVREVLQRARRPVALIPRHHPSIASSPGLAIAGHVPHLPRPTPG
jgi:nucleotide-binding universal stress UspA family protein